MVDEVKQAGRQWVSITMRLFFQRTFHQAVATVVEMPGDERDANTVTMSEAGI